MKIAVIKESAPGETRVALVPETVRKLRGLGAEVVVQIGAGQASYFPDEAYLEAGAQLADTAVAAAARASDVLTTVRPPSSEIIAALPRGATVLGLMDPLRSPDLLQTLARAGVSAIALELVPRTTKAQSMDVLSSQATVAGYRAVLLAATASNKLLPMLMTAAGTIAPSRVLIMGAGVAGLQAIATARRLGARVQAFDIRPAVKEEVESLGATWVGLGVAEAGGSGAYAKEIAAEEQKKHREHLAGLIKDADIVITTAQVPGRKAPVLITQSMVEAMRPGSVIIDVSAESGGNCELTTPGETRVFNGVTILGPLNLPAGMPTNASQMYSRNVATLLAHMKSEGGIRVNVADEIVGVCCVVHDGQVRVTDGRIPTPAAPAGAAA